MSFAEKHRNKWAEQLSKKPKPQKLEITTSALSGAVVPAPEGKMEPDISGDKHALMQAAMEVDLTRLKAINSHAARDELKAGELLDKYRDYLTDVINTDHGEDNLVLVRNMIWAIDVGELAWAIELGGYATEHKLPTPEEFTRDVRNVFCGEISAWALQQQKEGNSAEPHLSVVFAMSRNWDLVDKIGAELFKAMGNEIEATEPAKALDYYQQALALDENAGVKNLIKKLEAAQAGQTG